MIRIAIVLTFGLVLEAQAPAQTRTPVVVELFTSEGCSSCPPADNLLARLSRNFPDVNVIPLSEHVDYWNHLGWKDPFSSTLFSARQQDYGRMFRLESVYTPQMVVNGQTEFSGSDRVRAEQEIRKASQGPRATVEMAKLSDQAVRLRVDDVPAGTRNADMFLAVTESFLETDVRSGENAGRHLAHTGVVRSLTTLGHIDAKKTLAYTADAKINLNPEWRRPNVRLVLFVQDRSTRKIIGATSLQP
jgi:hypothetical protein